MVSNVSLKIFGEDVAYNISFGKKTQEIIKEHISEFNIPYCFNFPSGHLNDNRSIIFGIKSKLHIDSKSVNLSQEL